MMAEKLEGFSDKMEKVWGKLRPFELFVPFSHPNTVWKGLDKQAQSILDVGCGTGGVAGSIASFRMESFASADR